MIKTQLGGGGGGSVSLILLEQRRFTRQKASFQRANEAIFTQNSLLLSLEAKTC